MDFLPVFSFNASGRCSPDKSSGLASAIRSTWVKSYEGPFTSNNLQVQNGFRAKFRSSKPLLYRCCGCPRYSLSSTWHTFLDITTTVLVVPNRPMVKYLKISKIHLFASYMEIFLNHIYHIKIKRLSLFPVALTTAPWGMLSKDPRDWVSQRWDLSVGLLQTQVNAPVGSTGCNTYTL